jgi:hypothetical protein
MMRIIDKILAIILIVGLSFTLVIEIANLIKFGTQEHFLQHPDYPEGLEYKRDLQSGLIQLTIWTILTAGLLTLTIYSRMKKNKGLFNKMAFVTFILATYLPILTIMNGLTTRGMIMAFLTLGLAGLTFIKMEKEKNTGYNN